MKTHEEIKQALKLCGRGCYYGCPYNSFECVEEMSRDALTYIQQLENQLRETAKKIESLSGQLEHLEDAHPKWISVKEKLPNASGIFIAAIHCSKGDWIDIETFDHEEQEWWHEFDTHKADATEFITHWMPLPEPPKEETHE